MIAITAMRTASFVRARPILALLLAAVMIGAVLAGLFARWHDLALRPLAVDEYYTVRSVEFVLERGVPEFPSGGLYTRGLPLQYLLAASTKIFGQNVFAYRLPGLVFSLISVALAYWYARRFTAFRLPRRSRLRFWYHHGTSSLRISCVCTRYFSA